MSTNKVISVDSAMRHVKPGMRIMMGEFVGAGEPARCIEWLLAERIDDLTLITVTPGVRGDFLMARLFAQGQIRELNSVQFGTYSFLTGPGATRFHIGSLPNRDFLKTGVTC
jgi:acetate CoA/acetoacetate CoA-transferase alpha subunit